MPLTDNQAKQSYDRTLQEPEEKPKCWSITITRDYDEYCGEGTEEEVVQMASQAIEDGTLGYEEGYTIVNKDDEGE